VSVRDVLDVLLTAERSRATTTTAS